MSTLSSQSHLKYIIFTLFSLLGSLIFWRHCSPMSLQASTLESISTFPHLSFSNQSSYIVKSSLHISLQINPLSLLFLLLHWLKLPLSQNSLQMWCGAPKICIFIGSEAIGGPVIRTCTLIFGPSPSKLDPPQSVLHLDNKQVWLWHSSVQKPSKAP